MSGNVMIEWFDDLKLGMRFKSGEVTVSREDIKRFASEFDPQPFHLDEAAADFMRDDATGEWCFLEVNSQPMFAAFDDVCDGRLCDAMIDHLLKTVN